MIGQIITDPKTGKPLDNQGSMLAKSAYQPAEEVMKLFQKVQTDYQVAYQLQHRPFKEFDGYSLLTRSKLDQELFAAYVGCEYVPVHKRWRWKGRKNTARNKLIFILSRAIAGMLYPMVSAKNKDNDEDKMSARVMQYLVEDHLKDADYEINFMFMILSALVNPAVFVEVEYIEAIQIIKKRLADGKYTILEAVDELMSGLKLNIIPIDEVLLPDFFSGTGKIQNLPVILRVRRIPYDQARSENAGKYFDKDGKDLFDFVQAGKTRIFIAGQENQTLFDIEWTEADRNYVQEITAYYRSEDLEVKFIGGVGMLNETDVYNANPFKHRRMTIVNGEWTSIPVYNIAMSGFEPLDPAGRFAYYKSGAFKEYWDDATLNRMHQLAMDGTSLDVMKPTILSGVTKVDSTVLVPGGTFGIPAGGNMSQYQLGPNLKAAYDAMAKQEADMSDSLNDNAVPDSPTPNVSATQTDAALQQAKLFFSVFSLSIKNLIEKVGELVVDCTVMNSTVGELDTSIPGELSMKYKTFLTQGKDRGKNISNKIIFTDKHMGREYTDDQINKIEWDLYNKSGKTPEDRYYSDQRIYMVNPYNFARYTYTLTINADKIIEKSMGAEKSQKMIAFNILTDPRVAPYTDQKNVVDDFAIEEFGGDNPDRYKAKDQGNGMMNAIMGNNGLSPGGRPGAVPSNIMLPGAGANNMKPQ